MPGPPPPVASENDISPTVPPLPTITRRLNKPPVAGSCTNTAGAYARMNPPPPPHVGWPTPQSSDQQATPPPAPHIVTFSSTAVQEDARISFGRGTGWYSPVKVKLYEKGAERAHGFALAGVVDGLTTAPARFAKITKHTGRIKKDGWDGAMVCEGGELRRMNRE